jgi:hypothetical protein
MMGARTVRQGSLGALALALALSWGSAKGLDVNPVSGSSPYPRASEPQTAADETLIDRDAIADLFVAVAPRIVRIRAIAADGRVSWGSGVPVALDKVATNCHVTRHAHSIEVVIGTRYRGTSIGVAAQASDMELDLCILRTSKALPFRPIPLGPLPRPGHGVVGLGFSGGLAVRIHPGTVVDLHPYSGDDVIQTSTAFESGASGGGLFNASHELIGIMTFRDRLGKQFFSLPASFICRVLREQPFIPVRPQSATVAFWERDLEAQPAFLRAEVLRAMEKWDELEALARRWTAEEPRNLNAWRTLALSLTSLSARDEGRLVLGAGRVLGGGRANLSVKGGAAN